ncbi:MAG: hypothetical protein AAGF32_01170, partial [Pseudomonadota bacterium]
MLEQAQQAGVAAPAKDPVAGATPDFPDQFGTMPKSTNLRSSLLRARRYAARAGASAVGIDQLMLALCEDIDAAIVLSKNGIANAELRRQLAADRTATPPVGGPGQSDRLAALQAGADLVYVFDYAEAAAREVSRPQLDGGIVLVDVLGEGQSQAARALEATGLTLDGAVRTLKDLVGRPNRRERARARQQRNGAAAAGASSVANPGAAGSTNDGRAALAAAQTNGAQNGAPRTNVDATLAPSRADRITASPAEVGRLPGETNLADTSGRQVLSALQAGALNLREAASLASQDQQNGQVLGAAQSPAPSHQPPQHLQTQNPRTETTDDGPLMTLAEASRSEPISQPRVQPALPPIVQPDPGAGRSDTQAPGGPTATSPSSNSAHRNAPAESITPPAPPLASELLEQRAPASQLAPPPSLPQPVGPSDAVTPTAETNAAAPVDAPSSSGTGTGTGLSPLPNGAARAAPSLAKAVTSDGPTPKAHDPAADRVAALQAKASQRLQPVADRLAQNVRGAPAPTPRSKAPELASGMASGLRPAQTPAVAPAPTAPSAPAPGGLPTSG